MWFVFCGMICCLFIVAPEQTDADIATIYLLQGYTMYVQFI